MATGESTFTTRGATPPTTYKANPLPIADYDLRLNGTKAEIRCKSEPGAVPYIAVAFTALNTAREGGKDRLVFHNLFLSLKPGKDGVPVPKRADQLFGMGFATGNEISLTTRTMQATVGKGNNTLEEISIVDPQAVLQWLRENDGVVVRAHVKIEKGTGGYSDKNKIAYFIVPDTGTSVDTTSLFDTK